MEDGVEVASVRKDSLLEDGEPAEEVVEEFKEFLDTINPEDFED